MKKSFCFLFHIIIWFSVYSKTDNEIIQIYIDSVRTDGMIELNHGPIETNFGISEKAILFFVKSWNVEMNKFDNYGVFYNYKIDSYTQFAKNDFDPSYGHGVITVLFENIDNDPENELVLNYEKGCRTFYAKQGGYAGIKVWYMTKVFNFEISNNEIVINEYNTIGEILTVNLPMQMGTVKEEELIGRESNNKINEILGVTYNASQIKKRINYLKTYGLLGKHD